MNNELKPWWWEEGKELIIEEQIDQFKNGGALTNVEVSDSKVCIPEGALHKELSHLDKELPVTRKGINVLHTTTGEEPQTLEELQAISDKIVVDAEVETEEVIFSKELTDYVEVRRKQWNESKDPILLIEIGKRVTKELILNCDDNTGLIDKIEEQIS